MKSVHHNNVSSAFASFRCHESSTRGSLVCISMNLSALKNTRSCHYPCLNISISDLFFFHCFENVDSKWDFFFYSRPDHCLFVFCFTVKKAKLQGPQGEYFMFAYLLLSVWSHTVLSSKSFATQKTGTCVAADHSYFFQTYRFLY